MLCVKGQIQICFKAESEPDSLVLVWVTRIFLHKQFCGTKHSEEAAQDGCVALLSFWPVSGLSSEFQAEPQSPLLQQGLRWVHRASPECAGALLEA